MMDLYLILDLLTGWHLLLPPEYAPLCYATERAFYDVLCIKMIMV